MEYLNINIRQLSAIILVSILLLVCIGAQAQTKPVAKAPVSVKDTVIKGVTHKLYIGSRGGRYILVPSKTTGKEYKKYFSAKK